MGYQLWKKKDNYATIHRAQARSLGGPSREHMDLTEKGKRRSPGWKSSYQDRNLREPVEEWVEGSWKKSVERGTFQWQVESWCKGNCYKSVKVNLGKTLINSVYVIWICHLLRSDWRLPKFLSDSLHPVTDGKRNKDLQPNIRPSSGNSAEEREKRS